MIFKGEISIELTFRNYITILLGKLFFKWELNVNKLLKTGCILFLILLSTQVFSVDKVVYGEDKRFEVYEVASILKQMAQATALKVPSKNLIVEGEQIKLLGKNYAEAYGLCPDVRFASQQISGSCSGFLVSEDVFVTAGHCIRNKEDCQSVNWVFDFSLNADGTTPVIFNQDQVYRCSEILGRIWSTGNKNDYAVIRLDRKVVNRLPLKIRSEGKVDDFADLVLIGNPSGLPTKVTLGGTMRKNDNPVYFVANLDSFAGNSGSAVIDLKSGLVEGILVRGEIDFVMDENRNCKIVKQCAEGHCRGEDVTRITNILPFLSF